MPTTLHIMLQTASAKIDVETILERLANWGIEAGKDIIGAILIFIIGRFVIKQINKLIGKILQKRKLEISVETFLRSLTSILLNVILAFAVINKLGVETTSFAALLASAGVAVGMALSGNLSNFAGGLIILVFKPFKVGDYIDAETEDVSGTVKEIQIFHTVLVTSDNKTIYVPNGTLSSNAITNYSKQNIRRVEWIVGVEYGEDIENVKKVVEGIIGTDARILKNPSPLIAVKSLSASSVDIVIRAWTKSDDYWNVYFDMNRKIYDTFNKEGIGFPFPQLTLHHAED